MNAIVVAESVSLGALNEREGLFPRRTKAFIARQPCDVAISLHGEEACVAGALMHFRGSNIILDGSTRKSQLIISRLVASVVFTSGIIFKREMLNRVPENSGGILARNNLNYQLIAVCTTLIYVRNMAHELQVQTKFKPFIGFKSISTSALSTLMLSKEKLGKNGRPRYLFVLYHLASRRCDASGCHA